MCVRVRVFASASVCWVNSFIISLYKMCWRTPPPRGIRPARARLSPRGPRGRRGRRAATPMVSQNIIYDIANDGFPADSAPPRPPQATRRPTRTPPHQRGRATSQTRDGRRKHSTTTAIYRSGADGHKNKMWRKWARLPPALY